MSDFPLAGTFPKTDDATWRALAEKALKGADFDATLVSKTYDDLTIKPLYTRSDEKAVDTAGVPGTAPFTRGFSATRDEPPWQIRQLHAFADPAEINAHILQDLEGGVTAIALQVAAPGQTGVAIQNASDLERTLDGVSLDLAGVWLEAGHGTASTAQMLQEVWQARGHKASDITGGFGFDPLGTLALTGGHPLSLEQALEELVTLASTARENFPKVTAIRADARPYHGGGGSEAQELACLCATVVAYLRAMEAGGISVSDGLKQIELSLAVDQDFFANIVKLRAARALISRIAETSGAGDVAQSMPLHAMTSFRMFARDDSHVNILRTTIACAAAALGGANAITVLPYSLINGAPDAQAQRIARNIQIILQEESSLGAVIDPAGGSWYAEDYTQALANKAWSLFQEIEKQGGMAEALAKGFIQKMLAETAEQRAQDAAHGRLEITGVSTFPKLGEPEDAPAPQESPNPLDDPAITVEPIPLRRPAEPFERLRDASDAYAQQHGHRPVVALVTLGKASDHAARTTYAESFFATGGIEVKTLASADDYKPSVSPLACICTSDDLYASEGAAAAKALKEAGAEHILAVGRPGDLRKELKAAGVEGFIHQGCDMIEHLREAHDYLGLGRR